MRAPLAFLAALCVLLGAAPGLLLPTLAGLGPGHVDLVHRPDIRLAGAGGLPTVGLIVVLTLVVACLWRAGTHKRAAPTAAWACGQQVVPAMAWTSAGFTKALRLMAQPLLRPERDVTRRVERGVTQELRYEARVPHLFDTLLYEPLTAGALRAAAFVRRLQSGSLRTYLLYLLGLVVALLAVVRSGVLA
jgi:hypothetical protein